MNTFIIIFTSILVSATTIVHDAQPGRGKAYMDNGSVCNKLHLPLNMPTDATILVDSSGNAYSAWTQMQECLSYSQINHGLQFVCRGYNITGLLNVHQTNDNFVFWVHDYAVYNQEYGPARYPNSCATDGPHISFPTLTGVPDWGWMVAQYEEGGWWNSFWATPEDIGSGITGMFKVIGKQVANGNLCVIGYSDVYDIYYRTMSPDLQTTIASGMICSGYYYWGFDCNGGIAYIFYYDDSLNIYYRSTTDGITWTPQTQYNIVWPEPYANNLIFWTQLAVTDTGDPVLVFDNLDNDDYSTGTYPYLSKVYISTASGQPCVEASSPYTKAWYPTIAAGYNYIVVLYHVARANSGIDSLAFQDIVAAISFNGGTSFGTHLNLTSSLTSRPGLAQIAKRLEYSYITFYFFYGINAVVNHDPIWHCWRDPEGLDPHVWRVGWEECDGIMEEQKQSAGVQSVALSVFPNPFLTKTAIHYALSSKHYKETDNTPSIRIYDASGRIVRQFFQLPITQLRNYQVTWLGDDDNGHALPPGVYFVKLQGEDISTIDKVIKVK